MEEREYCTKYHVLSTKYNVRSTRYEIRYPSQLRMSNAECLIKKMKNIQLPECPTWYKIVQSTMYQVQSGHSK